jgi:hypothetical protein
LGSQTHSSGRTSRTGHALTVVVMAIAAIGGVLLALQARGIARRPRPSRQPRAARRRPPTAIPTPTPASIQHRLSHRQPRVDRLVRPTLVGSHVRAATLVATVLLGTLPGLPAQAATGVGGTYHPLQPARILDTRNGTGAVPAAPIQAGGLLTVQVAGQGGVPAGAAAVVMNVTATDTTAPSYLTVFPAGVTMPLASNLNWVPGETVPNLVAVALGTGMQAGQVAVYNGAGSVDVIFDVAGYYTTPALSPGPDGLFNPLVPARLLDTRTGTGAPMAKLGPAMTLNLQVTGRGGVPSSGVAAVVMNLTVTNPTAPSYLTAWPVGAAMPATSNVNFNANQTVPNRVVLPVGAGGQVSIFNAAGSTDVAADVNGWFTDTSVTGTGSRFSSMAPVRILDSRNNTGGYSDPWGPNSGRALTVAGVGGVPPMTDPNPPTAVVANITVTNASASSYLTAWPDSAARPLASDLNWTVGQTVPNLAVIQVGPTGKIDLYNGAGCSDVVVDVIGWFTGPIATITPGPAPAAIVCPLTQPPPPPTGLKLTWAPPPCGDATHACATYQVSNTGSHQFLGLDYSKDWIVKLPGVPVVGGLDIDGGHNVMIIGGEIDLTTPCVTDTNVCHGINISRSSSSTGEVYIEGVLIKNPDPTHSQYTGDGIDVNTSATSNITIQNVRVEGIDGCDANGFSAHADVFQPYHAQGAVIHVDHLTGTTDFQGMEINPDTATPSSGVYKNVNIDALLSPHACAGWNGNLYLWGLTAGATSCTTYPMSLYNDYAAEPNGSLASHAVWPDTLTTFGCPALYNGGVATWPALSSVSGGIANGLPPGGDFVPANMVGISYVSPGYQ